MSNPGNRFYEFGPFRIDPARRLLLRDGEIVPLTPKAFDTLFALIQNNGRVIEKDELMKEVWADTNVEEGGLTRNISVLRKALGESLDDHQYIVTIPSRGYRFVAIVREVLDDGAASLLPEYHKSHSVIEHEEENGSASKSESEAVHEMQEKAPSPSRREAWASKWRAWASKWRLSAVALAVCLLVGLAAGISYFWITSNRNRPKPAEAVKKIAVLPFKPLAAVSRDQILELGIADTLINKLSSIREVTVLSINSVRKYASLDQDPIAAGRELGVDYVLEGSLQMADEKTRATWRLLRVKDGSTILADKCDAQCSNILELQDSIAALVATKLSWSLTSDERRQLAKRYTESAEAYRLYITGRHHFREWSPKGAEKSLEYFDQAIKIDSRYAPAYIGLAGAYWFLGLNGLRPPKEARQKQEAAVKKALEIDETLAEAHASLSGLKQIDWDWAAAEKEALRALELNPNIEASHNWYANYLGNVGRLDDYLLHLTKALELDPHSVKGNSVLGFGFYLTGQYDQAIEQERMVLDMDPNFAAAHAFLWRAYLQKGMYGEAIAEFQKGIDSLGMSRSFAFLAYAYAKSGRKDEAQKMLAELKAKKSYVSPDFFALIYTGLGEKDNAFEWLQKYYEEHRDPDFIKVNPIYDSLHSDPRFKDLLRRMNLPV